MLCAFSSLTMFASPPLPLLARRRSQFPLRGAEDDPSSIGPRNGRQERRKRGRSCSCIATFSLSRLVCSLLLPACRRESFSSVAARTTPLKAYRGEIRRPSPLPGSNRANAPPNILACAFAQCESTCVRAGKDDLHRVTRHGKRHPSRADPGAGSSPFASDANTRRVGRGNGKKKGGGRGLRTAT